MGNAVLVQKIICVEFDGVLHRSTSGWQGIDRVFDGPVDGAMGWLWTMVDDGRFKVYIHSIRNRSEAGIAAMRDALFAWVSDWHYRMHARKRGEYHQEHALRDASDIFADHVVDQLHFTAMKPDAWLTIDDRAFCFEGVFLSPDEIDGFVPWYLQKG